MTHKTPRITVMLTGDSPEIIKRATHDDYLSRSEVVNKALALYDYVLSEERAGYKLWMTAPSKGAHPIRIKIL